MRGGGGGGYRPQGEIHSFPVDMDRRCSMLQQGPAVLESTRVFMTSDSVFLFPFSLEGHCKDMAQVFASNIVHAMPALQLPLLLLLIPLDYSSSTTTQ